MKESKRLWLAVAIALVFLVVPNIVSADEDPLDAVVSDEICAADEAPAPDAVPEEDPISLEELEQLFGANQVCGAPCGQFLPKCRISCGDAAGCYHGYCIYL